jgi:aryl-alcohol dehydrogenase-like predicted oxidoreductase
MKTIRLGSQGAQVPQLGLGCMRMSGPPPTRDDAESVATIIAALDAGVRFLNTGDFYGHGHNEALVARALQGRRDDAFLSVKFGVDRNWSRNRAAVGAARDHELRSQHQHQGYASCRSDHPQRRLCSNNDKTS